MPESNDFDALARAFQRVDAADASQIAERLKRARRKVAGGLAFGSTLAAVLAGIALRKLWVDRDAPAVVFAAIELGVPFVLVRHMWREQRKLRAMQGRTVREFMTFELARIGAELRGSALLSRVMPALLAGVVLFQLLLVWKSKGRIFGFTTAAVAGLAGPYIIAAGVALVNRRKRARLLQQREALAADLARLSDDEEPK